MLLPGQLGNIEFKKVREARHCDLGAIALVNLVKPEFQLVRVVADEVSKVCADGLEFRLWGTPAFAVCNLKLSHEG